MAHRRKQVLSRSSTFKGENLDPPSPPVSTTTSSSSPTSYSNSLAAQALRASSASRNINSLKDNKEGSNAYEDTRNDSKGFWGVLARKAKAILEDEDLSQEFERPNRVGMGSSHMMDASTLSPRKQQQASEGNRRMDSPIIRKTMDRLTTSLNQIGDSFEEGRTVMESRTQGIVQETRKLQIRRKGNSPMAQNQFNDFNSTLQSPRQWKGNSPMAQNQLNDFNSTLQSPRQWKGNSPMAQNQLNDFNTTLQSPRQRKGNSPMAQNQFNDFNSTSQSPRQLQNQTNHETQLKASRDVAMATAAKAKLLLRELKTVKADLAFAKERCAQLEEENKLLRESLEKGDHPEDDDLIRLQLETLLAEKGRLAHENSVYARENRFLREIVEYHQLSMQDIVYLDEGAEEITPVLYPLSFAFSKLLSESSPPEIDVEPEATPCSSTNHPRGSSPSPSPSPSQQLMSTEEASKGCHVSDSETDAPPTPTNILP